METTEIMFRTSLREDDKERASVSPVKFWLFLHFWSSFKVRLFTTSLHGNSGDLLISTTPCCLHTKHV